MGNLFQPIRSAAQIWGYGIAKGASDLSLELFAIFELVTVLKVKVKRNKKRKKNIMGPCTKPAYIRQGFHFRVFHKTNEFSINSSFFRFFVRPVFHFQPRYSIERKSQRETKINTCQNSSRKALQKGLCKHLL